MNNYIYINGKKIELTEEQVRQLMSGQEEQKYQLSTIAEGDTCKIGDHEFIVLEHLEDGTTAIIRKDLLVKSMEFGQNNNYNGSDVDEKCQEFAQELADVISWDNIILHKVDLTSDDGLKDYGTVERRASLLTTALYRKYVYILDKFKINAWWWLATAWSTPTHGDSTTIKCVSPSGYIFYDRYYGGCGVRPFCILKSNIFVSK